jgi:small subunit ribosomal protein S13
MAKKKVEKAIKGKTPKKAVKKDKKKEVPEDEDFRGIVRLAGKDMKGHLPMRRALLRIRGFSHSLANLASRAIETELKLSPKMRVGELTDPQIEKIDEILFNVQNYNVPDYLLNRRGDFDTGENRHVIMNDLIYAVTQDVENMKKMYSWKGYRHAYGQKVRGQKTRNTGRGGMAVGVIRKALQQKGGKK